MVCDDGPILLSALYRGVGDAVLPNLQNRPTRSMKQGHEGA